MVEILGHKKGILMFTQNDISARTGRSAEWEYLDALEHVLERGEKSTDRTGTGVTRTFGLTMRIDLSDGFPLLTTKKVHFKSVIAELLWFLSGDTNVQALRDQGVTIWDEWADKDGNLGPVYGHQWRSWATSEGYVDQIAQVIDSIKNDPYSRRHIVSAWNVGDLDRMALPPCHAFYQFYVSQDGRLSCQVYQRSADMFLGAPFNIASYAALVHMIAQQTCLKVGELVWTGGDVHIYDNHREQVLEQLSRDIRFAPSLALTGRDSIDAYRLEDFVLVGYDPHPAIRAQVAV